MNRLDVFALWNLLFQPGLRHDVKEGDWRDRNPHPLGGVVDEFARKWPTVEQDASALKCNELSPGWNEALQQLVIEFVGALEVKQRFGIIASSSFDLQIQIEMGQLATNFSLFCVRYHIELQSALDLRRVLAAVSGELRQANIHKRGAFPELVALP